MDPEQALRELREWARWVLDRYEECEDHEVRAAEVFDSLDHWLTHAGYLPGPWGQHWRGVRS
jgi:hypothetical protein